MKYSLNWSAVGRLIALFIDLCTIIRTTFKELNIRTDILEWVTSEDGKKYLVDCCLAPLGKEFLRVGKVQVVDANTILVNLGCIPTVSSDSTIELHVGEGWVEVQRRHDGLYVDGKKVELCEGSIKKVITEKRLLNANVLHALCAHSHLIPGDWPKGVYFLGTRYRVRGENSDYVHYLDRGSESGWYPEWGDPDGLHPNDVIAYTEP
jgi:hypothetical protein